MNRALLVGINNYPDAPLKGCVNDISDMAKFLTNKCNFAMDDVRLLADKRATRHAIFERLEWLIKDVKVGDRIIFHFSGHGVQLPTRNKEGEVDGLDEAICPYDFNWDPNRTITDKDFNTIFAAIPEGVNFIWISDSCHSGDLERSITKIKSTKKTISLPIDIEWRLQTAKQKNVEAAQISNTADHLHLAFISGCKSNQTSADALFKKRYNGALTYFLLKELYESDGLSMKLTELIKRVNVSIKKAGFTQTPTLYGCKHLKHVPFLFE